MALPVKRFWFLVNHIDRLHAEENLRLVGISGAAGSVEAYEAITERLKGKMGEVFVWSSPIRELVVDPDTGLDPEFDREGYRALKAKFGRKKKEAGDVENPG